MTVEEIQEDVLKTSETGNSYQAPGPHPPEPPRPGQPSPHPPEPPRPGQPSPHPPELPRPGQPSPHPPKPSRPEPSRPLPGIPCDDPFNDGYFTDCRKIRPSDCSALCRKNGCFCSNRFVMYGYQNFGHLLLCRNPRGQYILGVPGGYSQQERFMANMFGFPTLRNVRIFISQAEREDTGTVLLTSDQKNFGIHISKQFCKSADHSSIPRISTTGIV